MVLNEGNGSGLVAPITTVYQLRAELEEARGKLADMERRAERAEAALHRMREETIAALEQNGHDALARRFRLMVELEGLRAGQSP